MARIILLGTPEFAIPIFERVAAEHTVLGVITQPDQAVGRNRRQLVMPPAKQWALAQGVNVYQPQRLRRATALLESLRAQSPDVLVLAAYGQILREPWLTLAPYGCVGVHASLLPALRGAAPIAHAILNGLRETGISLMRTDLGMDTGPVIAQKALLIRGDDTTLTLTGRLAHLAADLLSEVLPDYLADRIQPQPQDDALVTLAPPLTHAQGEIDWQRPADEIDRQVRALYPWPGAWTRYNGVVVKIHSASYSEVTADAVPGTVTLRAGAMLVATGVGSLILRSVQPAGKRVMSAIDYANGQRGLVGNRLG
ncbi:MAG: methionyl-tRNA formyltransferase [Chloroflexi bacterium]|nr:methionyl-tRNA formyltransferase [Chloroflexota bacterium]